MKWVIVGQMVRSRELALSIPAGDRTERTWAWSQNYLGLNSISSLYLLCDVGWAPILCELVYSSANRRKVMTPTLRVCEKARKEKLWGSFLPFAALDSTLTLFLLIMCLWGSHNFHTCEMRSDVILLNSSSFVTMCVLQVFSVVSDSLGPHGL